MSIKDPINLNISILDRKKVVLIHIVTIAFSTAIFDVLKLLFIVSLKMIKNILSIENFLRIIEKDFVVPDFLRVLEVVDPGGH